MTDRISLTAFLSYAFSFLVFGIFFFFAFNVLKLGLSEFNLNFLLDSPESMGRAGGILPVIVSTSLIVLICLIVVIPVGLLSAIKLSEMDSTKKQVKAIRNSLNILAGVPSIVFGLFGALFFGELLGFGYSLLTGGLTLGCMVLPLFVSTVEQGLRSVPEALRYSGHSLGLSHFSLTFKVVLPVALPSIMAAVALSVGRALAETAALLFTSGFSFRMPESLLDSGRTLSVHIYELAMNVPGGDGGAFKTAFVLLLFIGLVNLFTQSLTKFIFSGGR